MVRRSAALVLACWALAAPGPAVSRLPEAVERAVGRVSTDDLRKYVETLASDELNGRGVGDRGNRAAEEFICATLRANGVTPAGAGGSCYQPVDVFEPALGPAPRLTVSDAAGTVADLSIGADFYPLPETGPATASAPLVFAGHGVTEPRLKHDDYKNVEARGAIVLVREGLPDKLAGMDRLDAGQPGPGTLARKVSDARAHGAVGVVVIGGYLAGYRSIWPEHTSIRQASYRLVSEIRESPLPVATISEQAAGPILRALDGHRPLTAALAPDLLVRTVTMNNVLAIVEGRDPKRRGEMVVVGAHLDHDGTDAEGRIYNGADDNASGTAAVLAAAIAFARAAAEGERPARAVLFALWNGEEKGSLGAEAFVASPEPARRVVANLNLDMVGRHEEVRDPGDWRFHGLPKTDAAATGNTLHVLGYSYTPDLAAMLREANGAVGLTLQEDYDSGEQGLLQRSDNWPFLAHGIPALFLTTGLHPDYHTPDDDAGRIDFGKLTRVARLAARAAWIVADGPEPAIRKR
ncbi:MAG TPA: M28 family peptidase [Vicinamibacterales bacterium]|nr:M28 family peptidase [Vicinamibacterales bacterium]